MNVKLNGKKEVLKENINLEEALNEKNILGDGTVVLINEKVVKKENRKNVTICENDEIEILNFVSGG